MRFSSSVAVQTEGDSLYIGYNAWKNLTCCHSHPHLAPLSKRLAIINQFWLVKSGNRFNATVTLQWGDEVGKRPGLLI